MLQISENIWNIKKKTGKKLKIVLNSWNTGNATLVICINIYVVFIYDLLIRRKHSTFSNVWLNVAANKTKWPKSLMNRNSIKTHIRLPFYNLKTCLFYKSRSYLYFLNFYITSGITTMFATCCTVHFRNSF